MIRHILTPARRVALRAMAVRVGASGLAPNLFAQVVAVVLAAAGRDIPQRFRLDDGEDVKADIAEIRAAVARIEGRLDEREP
jgi:hypothetical protein